METHWISKGTRREVVMQTINVEHQFGMIYLKSKYMETPRKYKGISRKVVMQYMNVEHQFGMIYLKSKTDANPTKELYTITVR